MHLQTPAKRDSERCDGRSGRPLGPISQPSFVDMEQNIYIRLIQSATLRGIPGHHIGKLWWLSVFKIAPVTQWITAGVQKKCYAMTLTTGWYYGVTSRTPNAHPALSNESTYRLCRQLVAFVNGRYIRLERWALELDSHCSLPLRSTSSHNYRHLDINTLDEGLRPLCRATSCLETRAWNNSILACLMSREKFVYTRVFWAVSVFLWDTFLILKENLACCSRRNDDVIWRVTGGLKLIGIAVNN